MNDKKSYRLIIIIAIIVGIAGITIGYAAFSNNLIIQPSAEVNPSASTFNVDFSSADDAVETDPIVPTLSATVTGFSATSATISNASDPTISNMKATFTAPGQSVTYSFYAYNAGEYIAYLNSITFNGSRSCSAGQNTTAALVTSACNGITVSVKVGNENATSSTVSSITNHTLAKNAAEEVEVVISYESNSATADGEFTVTLPSITLNYGSAD